MPGKPSRRWRVSGELQARARQLRREMTPAERKLWEQIRERKLGGAHIRRQHPVGHYIVDFFWAKGKLVIEVDGDVHATQVEYDAERDRWLREEKGFRILRFTNQEIMRDVDSVVKKIQEEMSQRMNFGNE